MFIIIITTCDKIKEIKKMVFFFQKTNFPISINVFISCLNKLIDPSPEVHPFDKSNEHDYINLICNLLHLLQNVTWTCQQSLFWFHYLLLLHLSWSLY